MIQSNFREWTLDMLDDVFKTQQVFSMDLLDELLSFPYELNDFELQYIQSLQAHFMYGGDDWNEVELENKFISPMIVFASKPNQLYSYFLERDLSADIDGYALSGRVDGMIATGFRNPKKPYFCLNEYKKGTDPNGDPKGQVLIAMLVAQKLNNNQSPIYGCYVIGRNWYFVVLNGKEYAISKDFSCVDDEVFDIYRTLKGLNHRIESFLN
ncbi:MAG: hypothetical protein JNL70_19400 [Saprospiraceae bacterium]|nr:hypothetical protein [Saprospiraceae bacterium]